MENIAVFASGTGTNALALTRHFAHSDVARVTLCVYNRRDAGVRTLLEPLGVECLYVPSPEFRAGAHALTALLKMRGITFIALAGFLATVPPTLLEAYPEAIVNIHPSLLPRHGGPGMWGHHVHEAVLADGDQHSGITIHRVNADIDGGEILFQASVPVLDDDTPDTLAARIHPLEHQHYPRVVENLLRRR